MPVGEYICGFLLYIGKICGRRCISPEGCCYHKNSIKQYPCTKCGNGTRSDSGKCPKHIRSYYVGKHYQKHSKKKQKI